MAHAVSFADSMASLFFGRGWSSPNGQHETTSTQTRETSTRDSRSTVRDRISWGPSVVLSLGQTKAQDPTYISILKLALAQATMNQALASLGEEGSD